MEIELTVAEALRQDVGRQIARIPQGVAEKLKVRTGDVVAIIGKRTTYAKVWRSHPKDLGKNTVRLDPIVRRNAEVNLDDKVRIAPANVKICSRLILTKSKEVRGEENLTKFLSKAFVDRVITEGDTLFLSVGLGKTLNFGVVSTEPQGPVIFVEGTRIEFVEGEQQTLPSEKQTRGVDRVSYEDIGGLQMAIKKIREMVELPMKYPQLFERLGISAPNGLLLYGPPGTGKTLLARAVASETNSFFQSINGPEIVSRFYGESENKLREIFERAEERSPSIIFIDEIDSIAPKRSGDTGETERRIVSQLLTLMDGINKRGQIVVIGATNRPEAVDEALRRGGRFDRELEIGIPDVNGRKEILQILTRGMPLSDDVDIDALAEKSHGFVGADFSTLAKEAALLSLSRVLPDLELGNEDPLTPDILEKIIVTHEDFERAMREIAPSGMREVFTEKPKVGFAEVAGMGDIKARLEELVIWPFTSRDLHRELDTPPVKGILIYGPPGVGKTILAKAVAKESGANFISVYGPEILNKYIGETEKAIRKIFAKAKSAAPCVILFDEIDSLLWGGSGENRISGSLVSQLLTEFDALDEWSGVIVIGTTNRPDKIDPALRRPGRFDEILFVGYPDAVTRSELIRKELEKVTVAEDIELEGVVEITDGYNSAEIIALIKEAKRNVLRRVHRDSGAEKRVTRSDLEEAIQRVQPTALKYELKPPRSGEISRDYFFD